MVHGLSRCAPALALIASACQASQPALTDANRTLDGRCIGPYADLVIDNFQVVNASAALGAPDSMPATLPTNAILTVGFVGIGGLTDAPGADLKIDISGTGSAVVRLAASDSQFKFAAMVDSTNNTVDVAAAFLVSAVYARVQVTTGTLSIDAFEATHDMCR